MSKSREELNAIKEEVESVTVKIRELTPEELEQVTGGIKLQRTIEQEMQHAKADIRRGWTPKIAHHQSRRDPFPAFFFSGFSGLSIRKASRT